VRLADYIMGFLADRGVEQVFLITGGGAMHLNDAVGRETRWRWVCNHNEQASAIAAEAYARLSGRIALVNVTTGPGGVNALNGVYGGYVDSIPMFVVSGQVKRETIAGNTGLPLRQLGDQEIDIVAMATPVTKYAVCVQDPQRIRYHLEKAWHLALGGRPGPVWLDIPVDVQAAQIDPATLVGFDPAQEPGEGHLPAEAGWLKGEALAPEVAHFLDKLATAERPVIYAGTGVRLAGAAAALLRVAETLGIPVVPGWNALDLVPNDHPSFAGRPGTVGDRQGNFTVQNADLLLVLGCRLNVRQVSYNWAAFARGAYKIMVDIDSAELAKPTLTLDRPVHGDVADFLAQLEARLAGYVPRHAAWQAWCAARGARYPVVLPSYVRDAVPLNPYVYMQELFALMAEDEVIVAANATASVVSFQVARVRAGMRLLANSGDASMGYDLPGAIGAALAAQRRVVCFAGDGSVMMNLQELQTLATTRLPVKLFVLNNAGYHSIRQTQTNYFAGNEIGIDERSGVGVPDFVKLAEVFGIPARRCVRLEDIATTTAFAFETEGPVLIEVTLDPAQDFAPKLASRRLPDGSMVSPALEDMAPFLPREELAENLLGASGRL